MSYQLNPIDFALDSIGFDKSITILQNAIKADMPWLDKVFHRAYEFEEIGPKGRTVMIPKVWQGGEEFLNVLPNDHIKSQLFFVGDGDEEALEFERHDDINFIRDCSLILWLNTSDIEGHLTGPSLAYVKQDLMLILSTSDVVINVRSIVDHSAKAIFDPFDIDDKSTHYTMLPYAGLRINFTVKFNYNVC